MEIKIPLFSTKYLKLVQGHRMFLHPRDAVITPSLATFGVFEPFESAIMRKYIKKGDSVLDIGANIGYYTLIFAQLVGSAGRVFAFEPDPENFALLQKNIEMNGYNNVTLVHKAVASTAGIIRLYICANNKGNHRIHDANDGRASIKVEAVRLDDFFKDYDGRIDFIKMDIEGAEMEVISGASSLLQRNQNLKIATEFCPLWLRIFGIKPEEYLDLLKKHGFRLYNINEQKKSVELVTIDKLLKTCIIETGDYTNLLCIR